MFADFWYAIVFFHLSESSKSLSRSGISILLCQPFCNGTYNIFLNVDIEWEKQLLCQQFAVRAQGHLIGRSHQQRG